MIHTLFVMLMNIKRLRKIPVCSKTAAVTAIHKTDEKYLVKNYRPISLLNIDSKRLGKSLYEALCDHLSKFLATRQHGFVRQKSRVTNMLSILRMVYKALDKDSSSAKVAFLADFSKDLIFPKLFPKLFPK